MLFVPRIHPTIAVLSREDIEVSEGGVKGGVESDLIARLRRDEEGEIPETVAQGIR